MTRAAVAVGLVVLLGGCGSAPLHPLTDWVQAWRLLEQADGLARDGDHAGARVMYEEVLREHPGSPWAPRALFRLGRLEVTPESPVRNYRQAYAHFDRLVREYPDSSYAAEARAWRETLAQLLSLRQDMERLKKLEIEEEREAARARSELERRLGQ